LLHIATAQGNEIAIHAGIPAAIVSSWPATATELSSILDKSDAIAIGPGLGNSPETRDLVERILLAWSGPVVVDADALNVFAGDVLSLSQLLRGRPAVITPHPAEFARLADVETSHAVNGRFDIGLDLAAQLGAVVLLKGTPTVIFAPSGERLVSATGTAALATGGSGDVLTGMIATLLAQMCSGDSRSTATEAAACAAFVHGRAAELCGVVRGTTLSDILEAMPRAWNEDPAPRMKGVLAQLESFA
jgi:NAD(P)H-hydrate epimerase